MSFQIAIAAVFLMSILIGTIRATVWFCGFCGGVIYGAVAEWREIRASRPAPFPVPANVVPFRPRGKRPVSPGTL